MADEPLIGAGLAGGAGRRAGRKGVGAADFRGGAGGGCVQYPGNGGVLGPWVGPGKEAAQAADHASAAALYSQILQHEPEHIEALGGLARALVARGDLDKAAQVLAGVPKESANHAEITAARSALELAEQAQKAMAGS